MTVLRVVQLARAATVTGVTPIPGYTQTITVTAQQAIDKLFNLNFSMPPLAVLKATKNGAVDTNFTLAQNNTRITWTGALAAADVLVFYLEDMVPMGDDQEEAILCINMKGGSGNSATVRLRGKSGAASVPFVITTKSQADLQTGGPVTAGQGVYAILVKKYPLMSFEITAIANGTIVDAWLVE